MWNLFQFKIMLKVKHKINFQDIWLENEEYKSCLQRCKVSVKDINIAAHGITAINTHAKRSEHKTRLPKVDSQSFYKINKAA